MIKLPFNLLQIERKIGLRNSTILVEPVFGKRPKAFDGLPPIKQTIS